METRSDQNLIAAYRAGDEAALGFLIERYAASIYRFLYGFVRNAATAEDLTQETFIKAWKHLSSFDPSKSFKTWLYSIAKHAAIDFSRKKKFVLFSDIENEDKNLSETVSDERPSAHELLVQSEKKQEIRQALDALPTESRSIVLMHDEEDLSFQEIAKARSEPMNTVKSRYRRALLFLRKKLGKKPL